LVKKAKIIISKTICPNNVQLITILLDKIMGRRGFEPLKHRCNRFQVPSSYLEAWTISSPWLLYIENIITLGGRRLVSAPSIDNVCLAVNMCRGLAQDCPSACENHTFVTSRSGFP